MAWGYIPGEPGLHTAHGEAVFRVIPPWERAKEGTIPFLLLGHGTAARCGRHKARKMVRTGGAIIWRNFPLSNERKILYYYPNIDALGGVVAHG